MITLRHIAISPSPNLLISLLALPRYCIAVPEFRNPEATPSLGVSGDIYQVSKVWSTVTIGSTELHRCIHQVLRALLVRHVKLTTKLLRPSRGSKTNILRSTRRPCAIQTKLTIGSAGTLSLCETISCYGASTSASMTTMPKASSAGQTKCPAVMPIGDRFVSALRVQCDVRYYPTGIESAATLRFGYGTSNSPPTHRERSVFLGLV